MYSLYGLYCWLSFWHTWEIWYFSDGNLGIYPVVDGWFDVSGTEKNAKNLTVYPKNGKNMGFLLSTITENQLTKYKYKDILLTNKTTEEMGEKNGLQGNVRKDSRRASAGF